jgi:hypothetical protein
MFLDDLWATPAEIAVAIFLLNRQIGVSCVAPVALSLLISAISFFNSSLGIKVRLSYTTLFSMVTYKGTCFAVPETVACCCVGPH